MGQKYKILEDNERVSPNKYDINKRTLNRLSNHSNANISTRIATEYYQKPLLYNFDNKVPGPGSCKCNKYSDEYNPQQMKSLIINLRGKTKNGFGCGQRLKAVKSISANGPGSQ